MRSVMDDQLDTTWLFGDLEDLGGGDPIDIWETFAHYAEEVRWATARGPAIVVGER